MSSTTEADLYDKTEGEDVPFAPGLEYARLIGREILRQFRKMSKDYDAGFTQSVRVKKITYADSEDGVYHIYTFYFNEPMDERQLAMFADSFAQTAGKSIEDIKYYPHKKLGRVRFILGATEE